ncbi:MAG: glycosyltransferase family 2 protein [Actinobacteria bacterium]|nr:MAG: glycosyltransferase family 2 protein [Actinomycetota bacterium]
MTVTSTVGRARVGGPTRAEHPPRQSIVIPTFNEGANIVPLLARLSAVLPATDTEIIIVDDSTDDTPAIVRSAARTCPIPVRLHHRAEPTGGLGGAVVEGLRMAQGVWLVVMDADLQHPPESVPDLVAAGIRDGADLVVASRYVSRGSSSGLADPYRHLVSQGSRVVTKVLFRTPLIQVSDPMSGFFTVRASSLELSELRPLGYKVLLELVVRNRPGRVVEVPYEFAPRHAGESKSTVAEGLRFVRHLARLRIGGYRLRMIGYAAIGASGLVPNLLSLYLLSGVLGIHHLLAAALANQVAIGWNFALTDLLLFRNRRHHRPFLGRVYRFLLLGNADLILRLPAVAFLVGSAHVNYLKANVLALAASVVVRFLILDRLVYLRRPRPTTPLEQGLELA